MCINIYTPENWDDLKVVKTNQLLDKISPGLKFNDRKMQNIQKRL